MSPALHTPSARDSARMQLHHMGQNLRPLHHKDKTRISLKTHCPPSAVSIILHTLTTIKPTQRQQTKNPTRCERTPPEAIETTPLLNPTTETGVERSSCVPSPSCNKQHLQRVCSPSMADAKSSREQKHDMTHHLALLIASPALQTPSARDSARMRLHRMGQNLRPAPS